MPAKAVVYAPVDGVVTRRNVNPGNFVQVGQNLMAVRSLSDIWVDANFKETELRDLRIGQPVDLYLDMLNKQLTYDALKLIGFDMELMQSLGGEMVFIQQLAHTHKICQARFLASKA